MGVARLADLSAEWSRQREPPSSPPDDTRPSAPACRAPTQIGVVDGDAPIMTPFLSTASITLQQKTMGFHDPIDAFVAGRLMPLSLGRAPQNSPDPTIR